MVYPLKNPSFAFRIKYPLTCIQALEWRRTRTLSSPPSRPGPNGWAYRVSPDGKTQFSNGENQRDSMVDSTDKEIHGGFNSGTHGIS